MVPNLNYFAGHTGHFLSKFAGHFFSHSTTVRSVSQQNEMCARRARIFFPEQECDPVWVPGLGSSTVLVLGTCT